MNQNKETDSSQDYICEELVFGLLSPIGANIQSVKDELTRQLEDSFGYHVEVIKLSAFIEKYYSTEFDEIKKKNCKFCEKREKIIHGTKLRKDAKDCAILAKQAVEEIFTRRTTLVNEKKGLVPISEKNKVVGKRSTIRIAYIIDQIKRREEIEVLNAIYNKTFFLIGTQSSADERISLLTRQISRTDSFAQELIDLDQNEEEYFKSMKPCSSCKRHSGDHSPLDEENIDYGQQLSKIFSEADIFIPDRNNKQPIQRFLDLIFSSPAEFPTSAEHAMFMAFSASTRSADLSRQVGAVIVSNSGDLVSSGSNDVPRAGGGLYDYDNHVNDVALGYEANSKRLSEISENISKFLAQEKIIKVEDKEALSKKLLKNTEIGSLTEFHRTVHAEMQAILSATRNGTSTRGAKIFVTTFPCHNCAKHIVAAGIEAVFYVEPYAKSQAKNLHNDAIVLIEDGGDAKGRVVVKPFLGVGPRRFLDLFSMKLSSGQSLVRKDGYNAIEYKRSTARMRFWSVFPFPFLEQAQMAQRKQELLALISDLQNIIAENSKSGKTDNNSILEERVDKLRKLAS